MQVLQELSSLGESNSIVTCLEFSVIGYFFTCLSHLVIDIHKKTILCVLKKKKNIIGVLMMLSFTAIWWLNIVNDALFNVKIWCLLQQTLTCTTLSPIISDLIYTSEISFLIHFSMPPMLRGLQQLSPEIINI